MEDQASTDYADELDHQRRLRDALDTIADWMRRYTDYVGSPSADPERFAAAVVARLESEIR